MLQLADQLVFVKTGKHLDYLQKAVLQGTLQGYKYPQVAEETYVSEGHARDVGSRLWKILSDILEEPVSKANVRSMLEKGQLLYSFSSSIDVGNGISGDVVAFNNISFCPGASQSQEVAARSQQKPDRLHLDLDDAPEIFTFCGRSEELATIESWIVSDRHRLVAILGVGGIGKTTLAIRLIDRIKTHFDYVIYRSLRFSPSLDVTLTNLLQVFSEKPEKSEPPLEELCLSAETKIHKLLDALRQHRCLIILDDVQLLFESGQLAGQYKSGFVDYHSFFQLVAQVSHQSCLILNSSEKLRSFARLEKENYPVRSLVLGGLSVAAKDLLKDEKLADEESWQALTDIYQGNPLWLELTANMTRELFVGRVSEFLQYEQPILCESLQAELDRQFQRLAPPEIAILAQLAEESELVALPHLCQTTGLYPSELLNAMQSLRRRFLLEVEEREKSAFFALNSVWRRYLKNRDRLPNRLQIEDKTGENSFSR